MLRHWAVTGLFATQNQENRHGSLTGGKCWWTKRTQWFSDYFTNCRYFSDNWLRRKSSARMRKWKASGLWTVKKLTKQKLCTIISSSVFVERTWSDGQVVVVCGEKTPGLCKCWKAPCTWCIRSTCNLLFPGLEAPPYISLVGKVFSLLISSL